MSYHLNCRMFVEKSERQILRQVPYDQPGGPDISYLDSISRRSRFSSGETILAIRGALLRPVSASSLSSSFLLLLPAPTRPRKIHPHRSLARSARRHSTAGGRDVSRQYVSHFDRNTHEHQLLRGERSPQEFGRPARETSPTSGERRHPGTALRYR